jgi:hypothetical protein
MLFSRNWIPANDAVTGIAVRMAVALVVVVGSFLIVALQIGNLGDKIFASLWRGVGRGRNK